MTHVFQQLRSCRFFFNNERANLKINNYEEDPLKNYGELAQVAITAMNYLCAGLNKEWESEVKAEVVRERTRTLLSHLLESSKKGLNQLHLQYGDSWPTERQNNVKNIYEIVDIIGRWLYFSATPKENVRKFEAGQMRQYYFEIKSLLEQVILMGDSKGGFIHASTAHYIMELCNIVLEHDPKGVIELAEKLCIVSAPYGYSIDSFAIGEVVKLVETCMADYREILKNTNTAVSLMNLLDVFVKAGWPEAINLAIKLDEIWR